MTKIQINPSNELQSVPANLTLHMMSKIEFQPDFRNPQILSFPNMYNTMGSKMDGLAVREHFWIAGNRLSLAPPRPAKIDKIRRAQRGTVECTFDPDMRTGCHIKEKQSNLVDINNNISLFLLELAASSSCLQELNFPGTGHWC